MPESEPTTQIIDAIDARRQIDRLLDGEARHRSRVLIEENGRPIVAVVSAEDLHRLEQWDSRRAERARLLERIRTPFKDIPPEQIERDVAALITEVRAEADTDEAADAPDSA